MHEANVYRAIAFTKDSQGGNEAGVVFLNEWPSEAFMQSVARQVGYSETAFVVIDDGKLDVRYFTPIKEVAMCGHASLALLGVAYQEGMIDKGAHTIRAKDRTLKAFVDETGYSLLFEKPTVLKTFKR